MNPNEMGDTLHYCSCSSIYCLIMEQEKTIKHRITSTLGGDRVKEDIQAKLDLLVQLNTNLNFLFKNPEGEQIEELHERLKLINQCIDMLLILFKELDGDLPREANKLYH